MEALDLIPTSFLETIGWEGFLAVLAFPGSITIVVTALFYYVSRRYSARKKIKRYTDTFLNELERIEEYIGPSKDYLVRFYNSPADPVRYIAPPPVIKPNVKFPRNMYDGFVNSTNIMIFDKDLQQQMHVFYTRMAEYDHKIHNYKLPSLDARWFKDEIDSLRNIRNELEKDVNNFRGRNIGISTFMKDMFQIGLQND